LYLKHSGNYPKGLNEEVNQLIKQFEQMSKMMKMMQAGRGKHIMQMMQKFR